LCNLFCGAYLLLARVPDRGIALNMLGAGFGVFGAVKLGLVALIVWGEPGTDRAPATGMVVLIEMLGYAAVSIGIALWLLADERRRARRAEQDLSSLLRFDPITGLRNRAGLAELWQARRGNDRALVVIELQGFERAAARLGGDADRLLRAVAQRLEQARGVDRVAQLERARFAVLAPGDAAQARLSAIGLLQTLEGALATENGVHDVLPAVGVAVGDGLELAEVLARASAACERARRLGGARVVEAGAAPEVSEDPVAGLRALREALDREQFVLHYQPLIGQRDGALRGFEALVRWEHPNHGLLPPARFLDAVSQFGLGERLDRAVVVAAVRQVRRWLDAGLNVPRIAVNLGAASLADPDLPDLLGDALARHRLSAAQFAIELTESAALADVDRCARVLGRLRAFGFGIALDDFGTGFSSLAHLRDLPVDAIKIDRRFIRGVHDEPRDAAFLN
jgi:predicted signal transduction protein with EAL and GGDEF domain